MNHGLWICVAPVSASYYSSSSSFETIIIKIKVPIPVLEPYTLGLQF